jgi:glycosyltransferase involved in cell wall biosynthesis
MIGIFIASLSGGGAERVVVNLANELSSRNLNVVLLLRYRTGDYLKDVHSSVKIVNLNASSPFSVVYKLVRECKQNEITSLLAVTRYMNILAIIANLFLNIRLIIREANTLDELFQDHKMIEKVKHKIIFSMMDKLYHKADSIIANSCDTADDLNYHLSRVEKKITVIHNPLNIKNIQKLGSESLPKHFIELSSPKIISIGRLVYQKNYEMLINAFALVKKHESNANLIILGKGPLEGQLKDQTIKLKIESCVHFMGFVKNPYKYLRGSDLFVLSSRFEGFGNVLVEALATGLPIVSTDCDGGPKEILDAENYGKIVPLDDEKKMAETIIEVMNSNINKEKQMERANEFSVDKITDKYIKVLLDKF